MNTILTLTPEKFAEIYTDKEFRNQVAGAHGCYTEKMVFRHLKTCSCPIEYIVTEDHVSAAKAERERDRVVLLKEYAGKLVFVGMGMTYEPKYDDDICNYRVRCEIESKTGERFFLEVGTMSDYETMRFDHVIKRNMSDEDRDENNWKGLERVDNAPKFTMQNLLRFVNSTFNCAFTEIIIDNHTLTTEDFINKSPR